MFLVVGLGNIGDKYKNTRHNIGFQVIDKMIKEFEAEYISNKFYGELFKTKDFLMLKPNTFMNLSGKSLFAVKNFYKIDINKIIVIHDDIDLNFSALRYKIGGGNGGHNGLKSIDNYIGKEYLRVRMGISKPESKIDIADYVLTNFSIDEFKKINEWIALTIKSISEIFIKELNEVKSLYSNKGII